MTTNQQALRDFRKRYKLTRKEAALELGYGFESWKAYETGTRVMPEHTIKHVELYIKADELRIALGKINMDKWKKSYGDDFAKLNKKGK